MGIRYILLNGITLTRVTTDKCRNIVTVNPPMLSYGSHQC